MKLAASEVGGVFEIAEMVGVAPDTVQQWIKRYGDFPEPWRKVRSGRLWALPVVQAWALGRGLPRR